MDKAKKVMKWLDLRFKKAQELKAKGKFSNPQDRCNFYVKTLDGVEQILSV